MNDFDVRQLTIMKIKIDAYISGKFGPMDLIGDLEGLLGFLEEEDKNWKNEFHEYLFDFEVILALNLDKNNGKLILDKRDVDDIKEIVDKLKKLVEFKLYEEKKHCGEEY